MTVEIHHWHIKIPLKKAALNHIQNQIKVMKIYHVVKDYLGLLAWACLRYVS
jgi:hypothetical protein